MEKPENDIIEEIQKRRTELLAQYGNDLERYVVHLRERQKAHPDRVVDQLRIVRSHAGD